VRGSSLMLCFLPINALALGTLPPEKLKNASGLYNLMRNLGGAVGLAVINTIIVDRSALHWARLVEHVGWANPAAQGMLDNLAARMTGWVADPQMSARRVLGNLVQREATVLTFNDCLLLMACVFFGGLLLMPLIRKPRQAAAPAEAH
jgi:MFS transporter, DHA2 family, multidrug resistance protein